MPIIQNLYSTPSKLITLWHTEHGLKPTRDAYMCSASSIDAWSSDSGTIQMRNYNDNEHCFNFHCLPVGRQLRWALQQDPWTGRHWRSFGSGLTSFRSGSAKASRSARCGRAHSWRSCWTAAASVRLISHQMTTVILLTNCRGDQ